MYHPRKLFLNYRNNLLMLYKNAERRHFRRIFLCRCALDGMAACIFLLKGEWANARSVFRAYAAYRSARAGYEPGGPGRTLAGVYRRSIVWDYFARNRKVFSKLKQFNKPSD